MKAKAEEAFKVKESLLAQLEAAKVEIVAAKVREIKEARALSKE